MTKPETEKLLELIAAIRKDMYTDPRMYFDVIVGNLDRLATAIRAQGGGESKSAAHAFGCRCFDCSKDFYTTPDATPGGKR